ncbi:MAG TPA: SprT family zinc-dependent metalloprotease [Rhizomicrobium sp.]|nr:SprT family zinc-dependent metalloprotease [Rhizomicrobium sp.]
MRKPMVTRKGTTRKTARRELLRIDGRAVEVTMRLNPRARRLIVKVHPSTGEVSVVAPSQRALDRALEFARGQETWIARQLARVPARVTLGPGAKIPFRGREHVIARGETSRAHDGVLAIAGRDEHIPRRALDFLKREARRVLDERSHALAARIGSRVRRITVRDTASRWGSCSASKCISYCWRLILAPDFVLDYVVAHEVAHLREMNHSPRFWRVVKSLVADIDTPQAWLRKNGTQLHRYGAK